MANLLKSPSHVAQIGYNGFDMSNLLKFTSTTGELLPVYYDVLYPGDKVTCKSELKTRTLPLNTAAMCNINEYIDWFFVPFDQLYSLFSQKYYGIEDLHSDFFANNTGFTIFPTFTAQAFNSAYSQLRSEVDSYFGMSHSSLKGTSLRLFELLGVPLHNYGNDSVERYGNAFNPMLFLAYQKIYNDYYRLSDREACDVTSFNVDKFFAGSINSPLSSIFRLRYRPWKKDFFTNLYVSPLFSGDSENSSLPANVGYLFHQWLSNYNGLETLGPDGSAGGETSVALTTPEAGTYYPGNSILSTSAIRSAFASQKLLEITRRAGKHVDDQTLAHFGVRVDPLHSHEVVYIGGTSSSIMIGDVVSTAETSEAPLGQLGGKGYNYNKSREFKFTNHMPCPGILMAIYSAAPDVDYKQLGLDKFNAYVSDADWFRPEFDNLGMQPFFRYQSFYYFPNNNQQSSVNSEILGWQYRFTESKMKYNRICGGLARSLDYWTTYRNYLFNTLESFLVSPYALDSIMVKGYEFDGTLDPSISVDGENQSSLFDSDPLIHELYFDVRKASKMSSYGLENL